MSEQSFYIFVRTGKLTDSQVENSFKLLAEQGHITHEDQKSNKSIAAKVDYVRGKFEFAPLLVTQNIVDRLIDSLQLDINDFKRTVIYKRRNKFVAREITSAVT